MRRPTGCAMPSVMSIRSDACDAGDTQANACGRQLSRRQQCFDAGRGKTAVGCRNEVGDKAIRVYEVIVGVAKGPNQGGRSHWEVLTACDFFTIELLVGRKLIRCTVSFVTEPALASLTVISLSPASTIPLALFIKLSLRLFAYQTHLQTNLALYICSFRIIPFSIALAYAHHPHYL